MLSHGELRELHKTIGIYLTHLLGKSADNLLRAFRRTRLSLSV